MLELGDATLDEHRNIAGLAISCGFDMVFFVGQAFAGIVAGNDKFRVFPDVDSITGWLQNHPIKDHHILIKGSRGVKMEKLLDNL